MPFVAIIIDLITLGAYFLQLNYGSQTIYLFGLIFQVAMTALLLFITLAYHGKRFSRWRPEGYSYFSIRYAIIVLSFIINGMVLFLYVLNFFGGNDLIFSAF